MVLHPQSIKAIPILTREVAHQVFPKGNLYMSLRDELGTFYLNEDFVELYSAEGQPALDPGRLALVCNQFKLTHSKIMWLEYFPVNNSQESDIYYGVQLVSNQIIRYQLPQLHIKRLLKLTNDC